MSKCNTKWTWHQNVSKTRLRNGTKTSNTSSHILLNHCYTFCLLLYTSILKKKSLPEAAPHWPIMALPWIHPGRIWPKSLNTGARPSSDSVLKADSVFPYIYMQWTLAGAPHWRIMALPWTRPWTDLAQKSIQMCGVMSTLSLPNLVNIQRVIL